MTIYGSLFGGSPNDAVSRLIIPVVALGSETLPTPSPLVLDTGSAGMTINAQDVFPADMVSTNGFVFPPGQNTLTYHGITVTNVQAKKVYGDGSHAEYGNIGFATVKFGGQGELTTSLMPVLFSYKMLNRNGQLLQPPEHGIFGINSGANAVSASGTLSGDLNICSPQTISASGCHVVSVLRYLNYAPGVNAGFSLGNATLDPNCFVTPTMTGCTLQSTLTVGLSAADEQTYASTPLTCPPSKGPTGSDHGVMACDPDIFGGTISDSDSGESFSVTELLLDSGTPTMNLSVPPTATFPQSLAAGSTETFTLPGSPLTFSYQANEDLPSLTIFTDYAKLQRTVIGIGFFIDHRMFIDLGSNRDGWK
ncbi:hypothetical protein [Caballeronia sp. LZ034LL]|uniref:hypothetical protein n=1 Tax=Caballeronia sp. LZ034LL TaxID=3038567 RepID=UPI002856ED4C|nr:hypothetical protein [Caballeronia sp. LZ034LL]MDR5835188.1 hypothetical protein [Caballeronia sp. LZ034LL]